MIIDQIPSIISLDFFKFIPRRQRTVRDNVGHRLPKDFSELEQPQSAVPLRLTRK